MALMNVIIIRKSLFSDGFLPAFKKFTPVSVESDQLLCLPEPLIPANGFVISGHGSAKKWINENIMVGSKIYLDLENKVLISYVTSDTFSHLSKIV